MDRHLARTITAKLTNNQRSGRHHPIDQSAAHRRTTNIPKMTEFSNL
jgi:hypothetical protein